MSRVAEWRESITAHGGGGHKKLALTQTSARKGGAAGAGAAGAGRHGSPPVSARGVDRTNPAVPAPVRPHSASAAGARELRPLGRPQKALQRTTGAAAASSSPDGGGGAGQWTAPATTEQGMERGYITKLKAEILSLQRKVDVMRFGPRSVTEISSAMAELEQKLFHFQYDSDPVKLLGTQVCLLELLASGVNNLSKASIGLPPQPFTTLGRDASTARPQTAGARPTAWSGTARPLQGSGSKALRDAESGGGGGDAANAQLRGSGRAQQQRPQSSGPLGPGSAASPPPPPPSRVDALLCVAEMARSVVAGSAPEAAAASPPSERDDDYLPAAGGVSPGAQSSQGDAAAAAAEAAAVSQPPPPTPVEVAATATQTEPPPPQPKPHAPADRRVSIAHAAASEKKGAAAGKADAAAAAARTAEEALAKQVETLRVDNAALHKAAEEMAARVQRYNRYEQFVLSGVDAEFVERLGVAVPPTVLPLSAEKHRQLHEDIQKAVSQAYDAKPEPADGAAAGDAKSDKKNAKPVGKGKAPGGAAPADEEEEKPPVAARLQVALTSQARVLAAIVEAAKAQEAAAATTAREAQRQAGMLRCSTDSLADRLAGVEQELAAARTEAALAAEGWREEEARLREALREQQKTAAAKTKRKVLVATTRDPPDDEAIQQELVKRMKQLEKDLAIAGKENETLAQRNEEAAARCNAAQRERSSLVQLLETRAREGEELERRSQALEESLRTKTEGVSRQEAHVERLRAMKDEDSTEIRKLSVELSICRNTITGLRQREEMLLRAASESEWKCRRAVSEMEEAQALAVERESTAAHEVSRLQEEVKARLESEADLRNTLANNETAVKKLEATESELRHLQRDFKNYTLCKIRQGETGQEDERMLQECLLLFNTELFKLPDTAGAEDVALMVQQLEDKKRKLDAADARSEKGPQGKPMGQLVSILKRRMNAIQLFAFREKRTMFALQADLRKTATELEVCRREQQNDVAVSKRYAVKYCAEADASARHQQMRTQLEQRLGVVTEELEELRETAARLRTHVAAQEVELATTGAELNEYQRAYAHPHAKLIKENTSCDEQPDG